MLQKDIPEACNYILNTPLSMDSLPDHQSSRTLIPLAATLQRGGCAKLTAVLLSGPLDGKVLSINRARVCMHPQQHTPRDPPVDVWAQCRTAASYDPEIGSPQYAGRRIEQSWTTERLAVELN